MNMRFWRRGQAGRGHIIDAVSENKLKTGAIFRRWWTIHTNSH